MRFDGICLISDNVPALAEFYGNCLDAPVEGQHDFAWVHVPGGVLSIFSTSGMAAMAPEWTHAEGSSVTLELEVRDVERCLAQAVSLGATVLKPVTTQPSGRTSAWFQDPDKNTINVYRPTMPVDPAAAVRDYFRRLFADRDLAVCDTALSPGYLDHDAPEGVPPGPEATRRYVAGMLAADPGLRVDIVATVTHGRTVAARVRWTPGPGRDEPVTEGLVLIETDEQGRLRERSSTYWS